MDRSVSVRTPESIAFSYELAGLGSRFLALMVDMAIQFAVLAAIFGALAFIGSHTPPTKTPAPDRLGDSIATAIVVATIFVVFFGYFIAFEAFWSGLTPGKKLLGIRVVRDGGYPIDAAGSFIRNVIRVGEAILGFYALSAVVTLISAENKRLGDLAAGTIVVRDERAPSLTAIMAHAEGEQRRAAMLTDEEHALIARFMARRKGMAPHYRRQLAAQIAERIRSRVSSDLQRLPDEDLLEHLNQ